MTNTAKIREEWIALRCQSGEPEAFRELVDLMEDRLLYYIHRILPGESDAYDVLQEVWIAVFRKIRGLRDATAFRAWIYRIAHDKAVGQVRRRAARDRLEEAVAEDAASESDDNAWEAMDAARVHELLQKLEPAHREVLTLYFLEDMKYEEIAGVVGCSVGTVKSRLHYAKASLRRMMEEKDNGSR
jgi:RNA polymerase sigma-70 factor (ECF subfamily)